MSAADYVITIDADGAAVVVDSDGRAVALSPTHDAILAALLVADRRTVDELVHAVWRESPPAAATASLHNHLSRLRRRAPGLVTRRQEYYALGDGVTVTTADQTTPTVADLSEPLDSFRVRIDADPNDERARVELIAALAARGEHGAAAVEIERAVEALAAVGLEPGRRLTDLTRMVADGERRPDRLSGAAGAGVDVTLRIGSFGLDGLVETARRWMSATGPALLAIAGDRGAGRSHALRAVRDLVSASGADALELRCAARSTLPVLPIESSSHGSAEHMVLVDDADEAGPATARLLDRLVSAAAGGATRVVVTIRSDRADDAIERLLTRMGADTEVHRVDIDVWDGDRRADLLDRLGLPDDERADIGAQLDQLATTGLSNRACLDALRLATGNARERAEFERIVAMRDVISATPSELDRAMVAAMLASLDRDGRRVVDLGSLTVSPLLVDDLAELVPDLAIHLRRSEVTRLLDIDDTAGRLKTRDQVVDGVVLDSMSPRRQVELHGLLASADYRREAEHLRARRHAAHGAAGELSPVESATTMSTLAEAVAATGDRLTAADISLLAADTVLSIDPARYCDLATAAGTELLWAGDASGLDSLSNALDVAIAHRLPSHASRAARRFCELGPTSNAGNVDERAAGLLDQVEPMLTSDEDRARLLGAATMVYALSGDTARCTGLFERAVHHAEASDDPEVLAETLPFAFLSLPHPDHLERREAIAVRLHELADASGRFDTRWEAIHLQFSNELQRGDPALRGTFQALREVTANVGGAPHEWESVYLAAVIAHLDGRLADARDLAAQSIGVGDPVGESRRIAVAGSILLACHVADGTVEELAPVLEQMIVDQPLLAAWNAPLAFVEATAGHLDDASARLRRLTEPGAIEPDCTVSAVGVMAGAAAAALAAARPDGEALALVEWFTELLAPWSGRWSWTGAATLGPVDLTLARLHRAAGNVPEAAMSAAAAASQAARLRTPGFSREAAAVLGDLG